MKVIKAIPGAAVPLGIQGENLARRVEFDVSCWVGLYGAGTVQLLIKRYGDRDPYPAAVHQEGNTVFWDVTAADTAVPGMWNYYELRYYVGEILAKSKTGQFHVSPGFAGGTAEPPEAQQGWVDQVLEAGNKTVAAATHPPILSALYTWLVWDSEAGEYVDTGISASGEGGITEEQINAAVAAYLKEHPPSGGVSFETDETLILKDGILSVNTADVVEEDNTLPVTSAAVHTVVGNISAILDTI